MRFSRSWNKSKKPKKQKAYRSNAPIHIKYKLASSHLSKELRKKHNIRSLPLRKGDKVRVMIGTFKGKTGKVERIDTRKQRVFVTGIELLKKDGSKTMYPIKPSNLMIQELDLSDKKRIKRKK